MSRYHVAGSGVIWFGLLAAALSEAQVARQTVDLSGAGWSLSLDQDAAWKDDELHLPPVDVATLPARPPSGDWEALRQGARPVAVPGTVEEYTWDELGDYVGVSWWSREFTLPAEAAGRRVLLQFEAVRLRAEVFVNEQLVGYDAVGNTPFEVDLTGRVSLDGPNRLAVRVTDPGGNFDWIDFDAHKWGEQFIPASHGFGGVTGPVRLQLVAPTYIEDVFVRNKPDITTIDVGIAVRNTTAAAVQHDLRVEVVEAKPGGAVVFEQSWPGESFAPGTTELIRTISVPTAARWDLDAPHLYLCRVSLGRADEFTRRFGFRWFEPTGIGDDAKLRLNGRRIVLRSAISWGFWPTNGIFPTRELAEKQIRAAKELGLNMLNFHRCIGQPEVLDLADELGLLYYAEPGGYTAHGGDDKCFAFGREKLLRMVRRDRSHPALVIYNMINEETQPPAERHKRDMADAHQLDPSRVITYTSGWNKPGDDPTKLHMRPYDDTQYIAGWFDEHHATGPGCWPDDYYKRYNSYYLKTDNRSEIVFWGEEGAVAAPPRLELVRNALGDGRRGWDGRDYLEWYDAYAAFLRDKGWGAYFPSVDAVTLRLGNVTYNYQGRAIENARINNLADGYVVNGWECEKLENHSGVVDCFRNFKGDPAIIARYNRPLYVAVKLHPRVAQTPAYVRADFYVVNERDLKGSHELRVTVTNMEGGALLHSRYPVFVTGGEVYGEALVLGTHLPLDAPAGRYFVRATLHARRSDGQVEETAAAEGQDDLFLVDWRSRPMPEGGAILERSGVLAQFFARSKDRVLPVFKNDAPPLRYILIGDIDPQPHALIPAEALAQADGTPGLKAEFHRGRKFKEHLVDRVDAFVDFDFEKQPPPDPVGKTNFCIRWTGVLKPAESGPHRFYTESDDGVRLWLDGKQLLNDWAYHEPRWNVSPTVTLEAGKTYELKIEYCQGGGGAVMRLHWSTPAMSAAATALTTELLRRAREDGTGIVILDHADIWAGLLAGAGVLTEHGRLNCGDWWLGGGFFVREHPLFAGLPVNGALDWEYQCVVQYTARRYGLLLEGEEAVVGCVTGHEHQVATAVGVVPVGRGRVVISTLDLLPALPKPPGEADMGRALMCNFVDYAAGAATKDAAR